MRANKKRERCQGPNNTAPFRTLKVANASAYIHPYDRRPLTMKIYFNGCTLLPDDGRAFAGDHRRSTPNASPDSPLAEYNYTNSIDFVVGNKLIFEYTRSRKRRAEGRRGGGAATSIFACLRALIRLGWGGFNSFSIRYR